MAESHEPKKETVRITLPLRRNQDTVRMNLPLGVEAPQSVSPLMPAPSTALVPPPMTKSPVPPPPASEISAPRIISPSAPPPPPKPAGKQIPPPPPAPVARAPVADTTLISPLTSQPKTESVSPKTETARITLPPEPPKPAVKMTKTQPLIAAPPSSLATAVVAPVLIAPTHTKPSVADSIPLSLCWGLLAVSAITLLIAIWTYIS